MCSNSPLRLLGALPALSAAMSKPPFLVQRDEEIYENRLQNLKRIADDGKLPPSKRWHMVTMMVDDMEWVDSDVRLINPAAVEKGKPIMVKGDPMGSETAYGSAGSSISQVLSPPPSSAGSGPGVCGTRAIGTSTCPASSGMVASTLSKEQLDKIEKNKQAAMAKRAAKEASPSKQESDRAIFEAMQWL